MNEMWEQNNNNNNCHVKNANWLEENQEWLFSSAVKGVIATDSFVAYETRMDEK